MVAGDREGGCRFLYTMHSGLHIFSCSTIATEACTYMYVAPRAKHPDSTHVAGGCFCTVVTSNGQFLTPLSQVPVKCFVCSQALPLLSNR